VLGLETVTSREGLPRERSECIGHAGVELQSPGKEEDQKS